jgi:hypothetical protein
VPRGHPALRQRAAQGDGFSLGITVAEQFRLEQVEIAKLLVRRQARVIGDVVGGADEIVIGQDQGTGKFSSRSPLPDRNSLAEVIEG